MDYVQAAKQAKAPRKAKDNYLVVRLSYDMSLMFPHKEGLAFLECMNQAMKIENPYGVTPKITHLETSAFQVTQLAQEEYEQIQIASLMGMSLNDVKHLHLKETNE